MTAHLDTNVLVRHLTGEPHAQATAATRFLETRGDLILDDIVIAELVYVLESVYRLTRGHIAAIVEAVIESPSIRTGDPVMIHGALRHYERLGIDFADAYVAAAATADGVRAVASFDRDLDRVATVRRIDPGAG